MGARSFFSEAKTGVSKQRMKVARAALPLRPDEVAQLRAWLRKPVVEDSLDAGEVARRVGLGRRTVLDMARAGTAFVHAFKPSHNRVRIPVSDVVAFIESRRVFSSKEGAGDE